MSLFMPREREPQTVAPNWQAHLAALAETAKDSHLRGFYAAGVPAADTPIRDVPMIALDVETTGLQVGTHSIVSLGLMPFDLNRIHCGQSKYWVVKPMSELSSESVAFHHITHSDIDNAPRLTHIFEELLDAMAGKIVVVHYRNIEREFLNHAVHVHLNEGLSFPVIDTMQLEAHLHGSQLKQSLWSKFLRRQPLSIRLADSRLRYNLPHYQAHHALTDAMATAELLQAQIATHFSPDTPLGDLWL